ncbi:TIGR03118 family protein [Fimbriimonas ginsengisoli]|uniref:TIGR03118 family protein n=1 Tax=Fimbriimonas ginsengisoli Gsoil 348 TaxID=661478 RepID=A0A068NQJ4_FIMGI|nr:TIGR03118 family protein [Fimbriimonas ginsengisoli]AIE85696.1 hypothetical protein OP10G_2328 [Fimbriimonas ginsengisoli Gsoil 348]
MKISYKGFVISLALSAAIAGCGGSGSSSGSPVPPAEVHKFAQTNLISDQPGAAVQDADLLNPWSIASSANGPFWVTDNASGKATIYNTAGAKQGLVVNVSGPRNNPNSPATGEIFNSTPSFVIPGGARSIFIFSTLDGVISAWSGGNQSVVVADRSGNGAGYTGLALGNVGGNNFLYATNFVGGTVDVFDANFGFVRSFTDPGIPRGFTPFGIRNIDGHLFVTYAKLHAGRGNGFVDVFATDGTLLKRLVTGAALDSPWGLAKAPDGFGGFHNALLVGNFGDGRINAFDIDSGATLGVVGDANGRPIVLDGLWALTFGNGIAGGLADNLYFTAGIGGEKHGLFGFLAPAP